VGDGGKASFELDGTAFLRTLGRRSLAAGVGFCRLEIGGDRHGTRTKLAATEYDRGANRADLRRVGYNVGNHFDPEENSFVISTVWRRSVG
jgi:hypothetical protein